VDLPPTLTVNTSSLTICDTGCPAIPASITMSLFGNCDNPETPLYYGEDPTLQIAAIIERDANVGCFVLSVEGTGAAPSNCQQTYWAGYGPLEGNYVRLCGPAGGCDANSQILILNVP
jgi:hypothetical protein